MVLKQVIVVNESLKLPPGKLAAQVAHASVAAFVGASPTARQAWLAEGMPKVVLKIDDENGLITLRDGAKGRNLPAELITDAGRTVLAPGTVTCLGIGPANQAEIDDLTRHLKLL